MTEPRIIPASQTLEDSEQQADLAGDAGEHKTPAATDRVQLVQMRLVGGPRVPEGRGMSMVGGARGGRMKQKKAGEIDG